MAGSDGELSAWAALTRMAEKAEAYGEDPLARAALAVALDTGASLGRVLGEVSLVVVKSEALVSGRAPLVDAFLDQHGVTVEVAFDVDLDAARSHALWSYPWVKATADRMRLHVAMSAGRASRCLIVRRTGEPTPEPLSVWLADHKGSSAAAGRRPSDLRTRLGMSNRMISFVHCPDEPADAVRDAYVLGGDQAVRDLVGGPPREDGPACWYDPGADVIDLALSGVLHRLPSHGAVRAQAAIDARAAGSARSLQDALDDAARWGAHDEWDRFVLAATLIAHDLPGAVGLFDRLGVAELADAWRASAPHGVVRRVEGALGSPVRRGDVDRQAGAPG